jgi:hypothetical protein
VFPFFFLVFFSVLFFLPKQTSTILGYGDKEMEKILYVRISKVLA